MDNDPERAALFAELRKVAETSLERRRLMEALQGTDLLQRLAVLSACQANAYQPSTTGTFLPTGNHFQIQLREEVSRQIYLFGGYEEALTLALATALVPGSVFYDVGAHYGYFSALASRLVGSEGRIIAFEPAPSTFEKLLINLGGLRNCEAVRKAIWRVSGSLTFNDAGDYHSAFSSVWDPRLAPEDRAAQADRIEVEAISIDDFVRQGGPTPDVIKLDVESAEMDAILGAEAVIASCRPMITVEVGDFPHLSETGVVGSRPVLQALIDRDYGLFTAHIDGLRPHVLQPEGTYKFDNIVALPNGERFAALRPSGAA